MTKKELQQITALYEYLIFSHLWEKADEPDKLGALLDACGVAIYKERERQKKASAKAAANIKARRAINPDYARPEREHRKSKKEQKINV